MNVLVTSNSRWRFEGTASHEKKKNILHVSVLTLKEHDCNINYTGPSSGMEADIILEGFKSCEQHGARFNKIIADGDSSVYKVLRDSRVYKNPDLFIEKLECVNHLCRNFRSKFSYIASVTRFNSTLRKQIKNPKVMTYVRESSLQQNVGGSPICACLRKLKTWRKI